MNHIVVVGSSNTDMVLRCPRLPKPGETVLGGQFAIAGGGKGANQAVAAARLGAAVTFIARVGRDAMGDQAVANYLAEGIDCRFITRDDNASSGVALIMVDRAAENLIGVGPGANATLLPEHVAQAEPVLRSASVLLVQLEIPLPTLVAAIELAHRCGVPVILNPAPAQPLPDEFVRDVILTPNETEAAELSGIPINTPSDVEQAAARLLRRGARAVVVTLGERGALLATPGPTEIIPGFRVNALDTTAAGDAFNGGLAVALARGDELAAAVRFGCAAGALAATRMGAQPSLPTAQEVPRLIESSP